MLANRPAVMTSIVDSEAQFDLRLDQVRLPAALRVALKRAGVSTISALHTRLDSPVSPSMQMSFKRGFEPWIQVQPLEEFHL